MTKTRKGKGGVPRGEVDLQKEVAPGKEVDQDPRRGVNPKRGRDPRKGMEVESRVSLREEVDPGKDEDPEITAVRVVGPEVAPQEEVVDQNPRK